MSKREVIEAIRKHSRQLLRELDVVQGAYLDSGCTISQCHVLFEIASSGPLGLLEIAENLLFDKSNTSRTVKQLIKLDLLKSSKVDSDGRKKRFQLTGKGRGVLESTVRSANENVESALQNLVPEQHEQVIEGLRLYASALRRARLQKDFEIRPIRKKDNAQVANVIRTVMSEFGAVGEGYSIVDPEVDDMYGSYRDSHSCYYVIEHDRAIVGCGGIAPLKGGPKLTCELRKMFFLPETRGRGLGYRLLSLLMEQARKRGFDRCYLETLHRMERASRLYREFGFEPRVKPLGNTGHCACECWYELRL